MFKKFISYPVFVVIIFSIICIILFGAVLRHHYLGGTNYPTSQKIAVFFAEIPSITKKMLDNKTLNINRPPKLKKHIHKKKFTKFSDYQRNGILILPRYDHKKGRSEVQVIDLSNFEIIHTYQHNITDLNNQITNIEEFRRHVIDNSSIRFEYRHPLILDDGSLISHTEYSPLFKIDLCSNLVWLNEEEAFHHSIMQDHEKNIWVPSIMYPYSKYVNQKTKKLGFFDDAIVKINSLGEIIYKKSVIEILIENKILDQNFNGDLNLDPVHLNDIEPALFDSNYWKKGDVFLSLRHKSSIIHFRPNTNKIINYIKGPFAQQHDIDIISKNEISIFNNNNFYDQGLSEILTYNFEKKKFEKIFNNQLKKENFETYTEGLSHLFKDGSLLVEEQNHGRLIIFDKYGEKEIEYINKDENGDIGFVSWSRIIEDKKFIENYKSMINSKKCSK